jgi:hypothetical protein
MWDLRDRKVLSTFTVDCFIDAMAPLVPSRKLLRTIAGMIDQRECVVCTSLPDGTPIAAACDLLEKTMMWDLRDGSALPHRLKLSGDVITAVALPGRTLILGPADDSEATEVHSLT